MSRRYDVTIWGATGFTGSLVAEYFASVVSKRHPDLRWSVGGRNREKVEGVAERVSKEAGCVKPGVVVGSLDDQSSIDAVVGQSRVLLSTTGPFWKFGTPVVDACVRLGTHYTDITGETPWVRTIIDQYDQAAREKGVKVVPMCGFDSVPFDLGTFYTAQRVKEEYGVPARSVHSFINMNGGPSGGTLASGQNMNNTPELKRAFDQRFLLGGDHGLVREEDSDPTKEVFNADLGMWTAPFGMSPINTRVVRRSSALFGEALYAHRFNYQELFLAPTEKIAKKMANPPPPEVVKKLIAAGRLPAPGSGPSPTQRANSYFGVLYVGKTADGRELSCSMQGGDAGYTETSKMVSEAALCLLFGQHDEDRRGGVLTPSFAFGGAYVRNLAKAGLELQVRKVGKMDPEEVAMTVTSFVPPHILQAMMAQASKKKAKL